MLVGSDIALGARLVASEVCGFACFFFRGLGRSPESHCFEHFYAVYGAKSVTNQQISEGCVDPSFFVDFREDMSPNRGAQK